MPRLHPPHGRRDPVLQPLLQARHPRRDPTYYRCTHDAASPRQAAARPDHPATVLVREDALLAAITQFCDERIFGPERAALLAAAYPADADARDRLRDTTAEKLRKQLARNEKAQDGHARELLALASSEADPRAIEAMRTRTLDALTTLQDQRAALTAQLDALNAPDPEDGPGNAALLDALPALAGRLADAPPSLIAALLDALNINAVYSKTPNRAVIYATITPSTPDALSALITDSHPTSPAPVSLLVSPTCLRKHGRDHGPGGRAGRRRPGRGRRRRWLRGSLPGCGGVACGGVRPYGGCTGLRACCRV